MRNDRCRYSLLSITLAALAAGSAVAAEPATLATSAGKPVALGAAPVSVALARPAGKAAPLAERLEAVGSDRKLYLVVKGLGTNVPPEAVYQLYLGLPPGTAPTPDGIYYVGSFNFFNAINYGGGADKTRFYSFDVTDLVKALQSRKSIGETATVTIVPSDKPRASAKPVVGEIALVAQ